MPTETEKEITSPLKIELKENNLIARFPQEWPVLSWAPFNGGSVKTSALLNMGLPKNARCVEVFRDRVFDKTVERFSLPKNTVGFMTAADVNQYSEVFLSKGAFWAHAIVTVGLTNARAIGDEADSKKEEDPNPLGTINLWVACNALPKLTGQIEAIEMAAAAKTSAMHEAGIKSPKSGRLAAGTGTDTIGIVGTGEFKRNYCGMHTILGELIGKSVFQAIQKGIQKTI